MRKREAIPTIRTWDDPVLKAQCEPATMQDDIYKISRGLCLALRNMKTGVGLAAPQIGIAKRIIVISPNGFEKVMINPTITWKSTAVEVRREGCLSYPGRYVDIARSLFIDVSYLDCNMDITVRERYEGLSSRIIQHEIDHLNGICKVAP